MRPSVPTFPSTLFGPALKPLRDMSLRPGGACLFPIVDRKEQSKSLTRSSVEKSLEKALELMTDPGYVKGPKKLGAWGVSYIYPMFLEFGIIRKKPAQDK